MRGGRSCGRGMERTGGGGNLKNEIVLKTKKFKNCLSSYKNYTMIILIEWKKYHFMPCRESLCHSFPEEHSQLETLIYHKCRMALDSEC